MLGLGWTEMLVIGVVALIVIGPKDLPVVMNRIGKVIGQVRRMGSEFQRELNKATGMDEVRNLRNAITDPLRKTSEDIRREFNSMTPTGPKPSGLIKPADPHAESVVDEIRAAAGLSNSSVSEGSVDEISSDAASAEPVKADVAPGRPAITTKPIVAEAGSVDGLKPARARKKALDALPAEPADSPAAPKPKSRTRLKPTETSPSVLPTEPADSPAAPKHKVRRMKSAETSPSVLPTEPADSPTAPKPRKRTPTKPGKDSPSVLPTEPADFPAAHKPEAHTSNAATATEPTPTEDR